MQPIFDQAMAFADFQPGSFRVQHDLTHHHPLAARSAAARACTSTKLVSTWPE
jgi:hypothetical protein